MKIEFFPESTRKFQNFSEFTKKIWRLIIVGFHCFHKFFILSQKQMWWTCNIMPKIYSFINRMNYWAKKNEEIRILKKISSKISMFLYKTWQNFSEKSLIFGNYSGMHIPAFWKIFTPASFTKLVVSVSRKNPMVFCYKKTV